MNVTSYIICNETNIVDVSTRCGIMNLQPSIKNVDGFTCDLLAEPYYESAKSQLCH